MTAVDGAGFGIDRPADLSKEDDEYEAFRKRMMLAYRFRPNPLVSQRLSLKLGVVGQEYAMRMQQGWGWRCGQERIPK